MVDPDFVFGQEQKNDRPALVVSHDGLNQSAARLCIVVPFTSTQRNISTHVNVAPGQSGLRNSSVLMCEQVRALSHSRFRRRLGQVEVEVMQQVEDILRRLLVLS